MIKMKYLRITLPCTNDEKKDLGKDAKRRHHQSVNLLMSSMWKTNQFKIKKKTGTEEKQVT